MFKDLECIILPRGPASSVSSSEVRLASAFEAAESSESHQLRERPARYAAKSPDVPAYVAPVTNPNRIRVWLMKAAWSWLTPRRTDELAVFCQPLRITGFTINLPQSSRRITRPKETAMGLITVTKLEEDSEFPKLDITLTRTSPTTSSNMVALVRTMPILVLVRPVVPRIVNVVPKLVEQRAAPAVNACKGVAMTRVPRENENAIGSPTPVTAIAVERSRFAFNEAYDVESPPIHHQSEPQQSRNATTFIDEQDQAKISYLDDGLFNSFP